ncbi:MAG: PCRF domain-containing protein, partial [Oscillospiraceae bacterium]|nr:PCRF domain-containing protein [Oscillospiraceae bacterium]
MLLLDELKLELEGYRKDMKEMYNILNIDKLNDEIKELQEKSAEEGFWNDIEGSQKVMQKIKQDEAVIANYNRLNSQLEDTITMIDLTIEEGQQEDEEAVNELRTEADKFKSALETTRLTTLLTGEYDSKNAILTFHAGAGGTEAQDWAEMLFRMYNRWAERHDFKVTTLDYLDGDEAGIKSASILVEGTNAYGFLKSETGVHRLVRIS